MRYRIAKDGYGYYWVQREELDFESRPLAYHWMDIDANSDFDKCEKFIMASKEKDEKERLYNLRDEVKVYD